MNSWEKASLHILRVEGGLVDHKADPGGITKYGISLRFLKGEKLDIDGDGDVDADDIRTLTPEGAIAVYERFFWKPYGYDTLPSSIALKLFDMTVNMGPAQSHKIVQRALGKCGFPVAVDGKLGPNTRKTILEAMEKVREERFLSIVRAEQASFYESLVRQKPDLRAFLKGWINRAYSC